MKFNRNQLLETITLVMPGIDKREIIEQMGHIMFTGSEIITYNDQISIAVPLQTDFSCSVKADTLFKILTRLKTETVGLMTTKTELRIITKGTKAGISIIVEDDLADIIKKLHTDISKNKWSKLPNNFLTGLSLCAFAASSSEEDQTMTCIKCENDLIECGDKTRVSRYHLKEKVSKFLIKAGIVKELVKFEVDKYLRSPSWIHFKTQDEVIFSCRRIIGEFIDYDNAFENKKGIKFELPSNIKEILNLVSIVTDYDEKVDKAVKLKLENNTLTCRSQTETGWITKTTKINYKGKSIEMTLNPTMFSAVLDKASTIFVNNERVLFESGDFKHIIAQFGN